MANIQATCVLELYCLYYGVYFNRTEPVLIKRCNNLSIFMCNARNSPSCNPQNYSIGRDTGGQEILKCKRGGPKEKNLLLDAN